MNKNEFLESDIVIKVFAVRKKYNPQSSVLHHS